MTKIISNLEIQETYSWLGKVNPESQILGDFQLITYYPVITKNGFPTKKFEETPRYSGYYKGQRNSHSYRSVEEFLVGMIAYFFDGCNSRADKYFLLSVGIEKFNKES